MGVPIRSAHSALCLSIRYPGLAPISLPSNPSLRQAICLHLLPAFLLGVLLHLLRPRRSGMGFTSTRSSAPPVSIMLPTNCLLSLYSTLLGRSLEAIGSSGSLLRPGCVLFIVVPYFPEKIIGSLGLSHHCLPATTTNTPIPARAMHVTSFLARFLPRMWFSVML